jgi:ABC-type glycerol-3-phosphate transport system permease component
MPTGIGADSGGPPAPLQRWIAAHTPTPPRGLVDPAIPAQGHTGCGRLFAGIVLVTIFILIGCIALQKLRVKGITAGVLKG